MKNLLFTIMIVFTSFIGFAQVDTISFIKSAIPEIKTTNVQEISGNETKVKMNGEVIKYLSLNDECNYLLPKYSELTDGTFNFKKIKPDVQASLSALGSSLSFEKKSEYYVYYFNRTKTFSCSDTVNTTPNRISYGIAAFVILKISDLKTKIDIRTLYDIAAIGQLGLATVELDVRTFGLMPSLANEFLPTSMDKVDIETVKYFDNLLIAVKTKINDKNTLVGLLPIPL